MGFIYQLKSLHNPEVYVGKSKQTPKDRFDCHKKDYKAWTKGTQHYKSSYELTKYDDCVMVVLESNVSNDMLASREGYWWAQFDCVNKCVPNRTPAEWRKDNPEYDKQYYRDNREKIATHKLEKLTCDCGIVVCRSSMARHLKSSKHKRLSSEPCNITG